MARPRWGQVREFCLRQGYKETRTDHFHYVKVLADRSTSGTMVSMGVDSETVPAQMWRRIWSRQLRLVGEEDFWSGLRGERVRYAIPPAPDAQRPLPEYLLRFLRETLHVNPEAIGQLTRDTAQQMLNEYYSHELSEPNEDSPTHVEQQE